MILKDLVYIIAKSSNNSPKDIMLTVVKNCQTLKEKEDIQVINIIDYKDYKGRYFYDEKTDKFFKSLEEIKEKYEVLPSYMYAAYYKPVSIDLKYILDNICEEYDITTDSLLGLEDLEKEIGAFNNLNKDIGYYYPNMSVKVKLPVDYRSRE